MTDAIKKALERGRRYRFILLREAGGTYSLAEAAKLLQCSEQAVCERIDKLTLIGMEQNGAIVIPRIQFDDSGRELAGLREIFRVMLVKSPWTRLDWLLAPEPRLSNQIPIDLIRRGDDLEDVAAAAELLGFHGAS